MIKNSREELLAKQEMLSYPHPVVSFISSAGYLPSEPIEIRLLDDKEKQLAKLAFMPCPVNRKFKDGKAKISFRCLILSPLFTQ